MDTVIKCEGYYNVHGVHMGLQTAVDLVSHCEATQQCYK